MDRDSVEELVALEQVQRIVLSSCQPLSPIEIGLSDALGFVLAEDVHAADGSSSVRQHRDGRLCGTR